MEEFFVNMIALHGSLRICVASTPMSCAVPGVDKVGRVRLLDASAQRPGILPTDSDGEKGRGFWHA
jgi:hypothetical protein